MSVNLRIVLFLLIVLVSCNSINDNEPEGLISRFGSKPSIDGVFSPGEWDDALIVKADTVELFRVKHDSDNLYLAIRAGGGDLVFNMDAGIRVLHWSAQLGSAEYVKSDTSIQVLEKPFEYELWGLQNEPQDTIRETLEKYLAENGWTANTASMGNLMESEFAISYGWLGLDTESKRFVEMPGFRIAAGLMIARGDPRGKELLEMSREDLSRLYPFVRWPLKSSPADSIRGELPETIHANEADYGKIWIDLKK